MDKELLAVERAEFLRDVSQAEGLSADHIVQVAKVRWGEPAYNRPDPAKEGLLRLFGFDDSVTVHEVIVFAQATLPPSEYLAAARNALGLDPTRGTPAASADGGNLTARRQAYIEAGVGVTYRTLVRHETEGAELIASQVDVVRGVKPGARMCEEFGFVKLAADGDSALEERIADLEAMILALVAKLDMRTEELAYDPILQEVAQTVRERGKLQFLSKYGALPSEISEFDATVGALPGAVGDHPPVDDPA